MEPSNSSSKSLQDKITHLVQATIPGVKVIYLFGSTAQNRHNEQSDIDIAVLCDGKLDPIERWELEAQLADKLGKSVDLVDLIAASLVMQHQVISKGLCLYDPHQLAAAFAMRVISMYQDLNIERAEILARYRSAKNG